jgi:hypothetical protein
MKLCGLKRPCHTIFENLVAKGPCHEIFENLVAQYRSETVRQKGCEGSIKKFVKNNSFSYIYFNLLVVGLLDFVPYFILADAIFVIPSYGIVYVTYSKCSQ